MPKHIHSDQYLSNPYELFPKGTIHPEIQHVPAEGEHYMLPAIWSLEKGKKVIPQYPAPGVYYISEGEIEYEDTKNPGEVHKLSAGAVLHLEKDSRLRWFTPNSIAKGFAAFWVPIAVKSFESFVGSEE